GAVTLHGHGHTQQGRIANLGEGGAYVLTSVSPPDRLLGRTVDIEIRLDGGHAEWIGAIGRVIRIRPNGLAVAFDTPPAVLLRMIDQITTASRARDRVLAVVLIDTHAQRRSAMAAGFRATGCNVVEAA